MSEEELVIFDILTRPAPDLSTEERAEVKKVARQLLARLKELLVLNWRQKASARSQLKPVRETGRRHEAAGRRERRLHPSPCRPPAAHG